MIPMRRSTNLLPTPRNPLEGARMEAWVAAIDDPTEGQLVDPERIDDAAALLRGHIRYVLWRRRLQLIIPLTAAAFLGLGVLLLMIKAPSFLILGSFAAAVLLFLSQPKTIPVWNGLIASDARDGSAPQYVSEVTRGRIRYSTIFRSADVLDRYYVATHDPVALWEAAAKEDRRVGMLDRIESLARYETLSEPRRQELDRLQRSAEALVDEIVHTLDPDSVNETAGAARSKAGEAAS